MPKAPAYSATEEARKRFVSDYVKRARGLRKDARGRFREERYPEVVSTVQEALEVGVKALFHAARIPPPRTHRVHDAKFRHQLTRVIEVWDEVLTPAERERVNIARVLFLASFWAGFYLEAKYGSELLGLGPSQLFGRQEAQLGLAHLEEFVQTLADLAAGPPEEDACEGGAR